MRNAKSLGVLVSVALFNAALIYGCSSDDAGPVGTEDSGADGSNEAGSITPDTGSGGADVKTDTKSDAKTDAKKDGTSDAIVEAAPDTNIVFDPEGSPCGPLNTVQKRPCGLCGEQQRLCLKAADAGADSGGGQPGVWYPWSGCVNGAGAVCDPLQTYTDENCGNCGTRARICQLDCTFVQGLTCNNEGACKAGSEDWEQFDCTFPLGRKKTCDSTCQYDIATACTAAPPNPNNIIVNNATAGTVFQKVFSFDASKKIKGIDGPGSGIGACPLASLDATQVLYQYVEIKNTTASNVKVSIYHTNLGATAPVGPEDTQMAVYVGPNYPRTDAERLNCLDFVSDGCSSTAGATFTPVACGGGFSANAGIIKGETVPTGTYPGVQLNAGQSVTAYIQPFSSVATAGNFKIVVRVETN